MWTVGSRILSLKYLVSYGPVGRISLTVTAFENIAAKGDSFDENMLEKEKMLVTSIRILNLSRCECVFRLEWQVNPLPNLD